MTKNSTETRLVLREHNTNNSNDFMNSFIHKNGALQLNFNMVWAEMLEGEYIVVTTQSALEEYFGKKLQDMKLMCNFVLPDDIDTITKEIKKQLSIMRDGLDELIVACDKPVIDKRLNKE